MSGLLISTKKSKMKKIPSIFALLFIFSASFSQVFEKSKIVCGLNYDFAVYSTLSKDKSSGETDTDGAAANNYSAWGEYGVLERLGAGLKLGYASFIAGVDSASGVRPTAGSFDYGVFINYHLVNKTKFDLPVGAGVGGSSFKYRNNLTDNGIVKGNGLQWNIGVNPRIFFGKFGINFRLAYASYSYGSLDVTTNNSSEPDALSYKGSGVQVGAGFQLKF
jgi:hypothetical protein